MDGGQIGKMGSEIGSIRGSTTQQTQHTHQREHNTTKTTHTPEGIHTTQNRSEGTKQNTAPREHNTK